MKINKKYEVSPFGDAFDSFFSLLFRNDNFPHSLDNMETQIGSNLDLVRYKDEESSVRIEILVPGWKKNGP